MKWYIIGAFIFDAVALFCFLGLCSWISECRCLICCRKKEKIMMEEAMRVADVFDRDFLFKTRELARQRYMSLR